MLSSRLISANGIEIFVTEQGSGPLVLLCHGWPELSHSWRHQLPAIAAAGFHVVAPDMRGFGRTSAPESVESYSIFDLVGDMVALVAELGETKAIIVGHDWGAPVAWHAALFRPDIFTAVGGLSVAPPWRGHERPMETLAKSGITNFYWQYFQKPGVAEAEFERDVDYTMRAISFGVDDSLYLREGFGFLGNPAIERKLPDWIGPADHAHVVETYRRTGFRGGLNWYRNIDRNWDLTAPWHGAQIHQPAIFIAGAKDSVVTSILGGKRVTEMHRVLPNLKRKLIIEGAGHWIQQERRDEVNAALIEFLKDVSG
ncbi:alpha/beta hydrolase [Bradyrhizobium sp. G127]|uniref:alpha/beta fold hydrolase n=1 Tax=Bradyrhizobium sp. G127 TaxID=2904800 RepID=UPI001F32B9B1|nr:alpha/beta hydrolase [Bradyrhizobium sp. G127]MCF2523620.1 alpha/beta hydrolase [Bradyrhizobium sp. G127]